MKQRPPRLAEWLAANVVPREARDAVLGDLHERYLERLRRKGSGAADRWYVRQVGGFAWQLPAAKARAMSGRMRRAVSPGALAVDLKYAGRAVIRQPGLTMAVGAVLALGVGAAATVFSLVSGVLLRALPYADPQALVMVWDEYEDAPAGGDPKPLTLLHYRALQEQTAVFSSIGAFESIPSVISAGEWTERVDSALVTATLFETLGVAPSLGRLFTADDDREGAQRVVILSHELWRSHYGGDDAIVGRSIDIDGQPAQVIGVMPQTFWFYDPYAVTRSYRGASASAARLWRPVAGSFNGETDYARYRVLARLRSGVTLDAATGAVAAVERSLPAALKSADGRVRIVPLNDQVVNEVRPRLIGLAAAVALVLLIASVNLVSLLVARLSARRGEFALRMALGASRGRLARALMMHMSLLAALGGIAGLLLAMVAVPQVMNLVPRGLPLAYRVAVDPLVVAFAFALAFTVAIGVTALALRRYDRTVTGRRFTRGLIAAEVAFSLVLLISATVLLRSFAGVYSTDPGFAAEDTLTFQSLLMLSSPGAPPDFGFFDRLEARLTTLPGVTAVSSAAVLPFSRWKQVASVRVGESTPGAPDRQVNYRVVSSGYFETLRIGVLGGRTFASADAPGAEPTAIVNRAFVEQFHLDPVLGQRVRVARGRTIERVIIGIVEDIREEQLFAPARPTIYVPITGAPMPMRQFVVRAANPVALIEPIRAAAAEVDPRQPLQDFITLEALIGQSIEEERFYAVVTASFAAIAALLSVCGLYGVVSLTARQRDREVGVRMALGAQPGAVYRLIVADGMRPVALGLVAGCAGAAVSAGLLQNLLHGVPGIDPVSYAGATVTFAVVAAAACLIPARRAARLDPVRTLNQQ